MAGAQVRVRELAEGTYGIEQWDTVTGERRELGVAECDAEGLVVNVPPVEADVAMKVAPADTK